MSAELRQRVLSQDGGEGSSNPYRRMTRDEIKRLQKIQAEKESGIDTGSILWILAGIWVVHYFDVVDAVQYDTSIHRQQFNIGCALMGVSGLVAVYCLVWLDMVCKIRDFERHAPWAVPASTICAIAGWVLIALGVWPMWGWMTLFIVPTLTMASLLGLVIVSELVHL